MQGGGSNETLGAEVYKLVSLSEPIPYQVEALTTFRDLLFVGTTNGRIVIYRMHTGKLKDVGSSSRGSGGGGITVSNASAVTQLQDVADPRHQPIRALTVVGDYHLSALIGDTIVLYTFVHDEQDSSRPSQLREITAITGLRDTLSFHVKQQKGIIALAALQRRRLTVYEATFAHLEFLLKETVTLPDGVRTFAWMGRSYMLGGRKDYFFYHASTSSSTALYPTPRSGAMPLVLPMAPVPEVLVTSDGGGMRALLSDGSEVPGDSRVAWTSPPAALSYDHPFVISQHIAGPHTLQIRLPLLTTLDASVKSSSKNSLLQYIDIPKLAKISQCGWTDYDCPMPSKTMPSQMVGRHPTIAVDTSSRLFFLLRTSIAAQVESLASRQLFAAADLLCRLCPHEVQEDTLQSVVVAGAMYRFLFLKDYSGCFHELSRIEADPRLAIQLFPGFMPCTSSSSSSLSAQPQLPPTVSPPTSAVTAALPAFAEYLQSRRIALLLRGKAFLETEVARSQLRCVDHALVMAWCAMKAEAPLLTLLQSDNWCSLDEAATVLQQHELWVALVVLLEAGDRYEAAAETLRRLVEGDGGETPGDHAMSPPRDVMDVVHRFFQERDVLPTSDEAYLPQTTIQEWIHTMLAQGANSSRADVTRAVIGATTALIFFRRRALPAQQRLFSQHVAWVLGCAPPDTALRVFFSNHNVQHYAAVLRLLQGYTAPPGCVPAQLLMVSYLYLLFIDSRVDVTEELLYEQYWKGLGDVLFPTPDAAAASVLSDTSEQQKYRSRLDEFLLTSSHVDLAAAAAYFDADARKEKCIPERALICRRKGEHRSAVEMFVLEADDMAGAMSYASGVRSEDGGDAFTALLELLLKPSHGTPRVDEALTIVNTCDGVDASLVLPMLPDDLPFAALSSFLLHAFRDAATAYHMSAIDSSVLRAKLMQAEETRVRELSRSALLEDATVCPVCQRRIRPDTVLAVYPSGLLVHQGCVKDEHVCPATHRDYRHDAYALLEDL
jgi:Vam6/Vps39-like protein vacuolar protein sorting-associated protein 39